jgi:hypothetical protein
VCVYSFCRFLWLKEISCIHAEGYPAGEMKHGPNALIDESLPVVCIATKDPNDPSSVLKYEKTLSNIQDVTARSGRVIAIATEGDPDIAQLVDHTIYIPQAPGPASIPHPLLSPAGRTITESHGLFSNRRRVLKPLNPFHPQLKRKHACCRRC